MVAIEDNQLGTAKQDVLEELGESALVLPSLINRGLEANERAKYLLALLQTARSQCDAPSDPCPSLRDERLVAGVADPQLDEVIGQSRLDGGTYRIPLAARIHEELIGAIREMLAPLASFGSGDTPSESRLEALLECVPDLADDRVPGEYIDRMAAARRDKGDSLHLLVMDAHQALNRLQRQVATSTLDGAFVYGLAEEDRALVSAFMGGVRETSPLKFEHPGLASTATRVGGRLLIQNDLGTTSAHVVVLTIEGLSAALIYTDVHRRRLEFFQSLLDEFAVKWSSPESRAHPILGEHHVIVGTYDGEDRASLEAYLHRVGSRLVFVLDWNRARKRLRMLVGNDDAIELLRWAAENNLGHMAFLSLGGERLIYDALEFAEKAPARYGEPVIDVLGREETLAIARFALRAAAEGLLAGKSSLLIRDEVRVEVLRHLQVSQRRLLDAAAEHASLIVECSKALQAALVQLGGPGGEDFLARTAERAARWEHRADEVLMAQRQAARHVDGGVAVTNLTSIADDAIDALEEVIFLLTLLPSQAVGATQPILEPLAALATATAREHLKAVEIAREVVGGSSPEDLEDFLVAVDRVASLEHEADSADRMARATLVTDAPDFRSLYIADCVSRGAEDATDALLRAALGLRDHILGLLSAQ